MPLDTAAIHARLRERFGETIGDLTGVGRDAWALVPPGDIAEVARFAHDDGELGFDCLSNLSGVD
jgi:hypothetical protein